MTTEVDRRLVHASGALVPGLYLAGVLTWRQLQGLLVLVAVVVLVLEFLRLQVGLESWIYDRLTREYEADSFAGYGYYILSSSVVALFFEPAVAVPALLMLMIGDPLSGLSSQETQGRVKAWPALTAMAGFSVIAATPFMVALQPSTPWAVAAACCGAVPATIADGVQLRVGDWIIDDNLLIPIGGAVGLWLGVIGLPPAL